MVKLLDEERKLADFHTTVWPGEPLPLPLVGRFRAVEHPDGLEYFLGDEPDAVLPPELVLREVPRIDPDDRPALLTFMNRYGPLTSLDGAGLTLLPSVALGHFDKEGVDPDGRIPFTVVRYHLRALRALVEHWRAFQAGDDKAVLDAWTDLTVNEYRGRPLTSSWFACYLWASHMNAALAPLSAHVVVRGGDTARHPFFEQVFLTAYTAMVVEVFNDVSTGSVWRRCANETCPNGPRALFARQLGAAKKTGRVRTTGVIYCSRTCAKAQVERVRRRKIAQKRKGEHRDG